MGGDVEVVGDVIAGITRAGIDPLPYSMRMSRFTWKANANSYYWARRIEYGYIDGYTNRWGHCPPGQIRSCK